MKKIANQIHAVAEKALRYVDKDLASIEINKDIIDELDLFMMFLESMKHSYFADIVAIENSNGLSKKEFDLLIDVLLEKMKSKHAGIIEIANLHLDTQAQKLKEDNKNE